MLGVLLIVVLLLAFANGANDNFKGVATLFGSGTTDYRRALLWATATTMLGSLLAAWLGRELLARFSGKGLIPLEFTEQAQLLGATAMAAGLTVLLATKIGMPISTTHALVGGLLGSAIAASAAINWVRVGSVVLAPLVFSPIIALFGTALVYSMLRWVRLRLGITKESCVCVGGELIPVTSLNSNTLALSHSNTVTASFGTTELCQERYGGTLMGVNCGKALDSLHYLSSGLVSFARGLNDTPKIAALLAATPLLGPLTTAILCGLVMALGGLAAAKRVAFTMSERITPMNPGQGFSANLITGLLVIGATRLGMPVSTTHVSCGSLFGVGAASGQACWDQISRIVSAWIITLPLAGLLGAFTYLLIGWLGW